MAIKGLTDRNLAFPEIGQIRKGGKKTDPKKPGPDLDYFRVEFDEREVEAARAFRDRYGDQPTEINIILPFNEIERMWDAWLEAYTAGRMVARSDGEIYTYLVDTQSGAILVKNGIDVKTGQPRPYIDGAPVGSWRNQNNRDEPIFCKPTGRLKVVIPELGRAAYLTVMTTSVHDIANISAQLAAFQQVNGGRIAGIPLVLRRRPKMISTPSAGGSRARRKKWMLSIEAGPTWVKRMLTEVRRLALPGNGLPLPALPPGAHDDQPGPSDYADLVDDDEGDGEDFADEAEEGEYAMPPEPQPQPTNGERPLAPEALLARVRAIAQQAEAQGKTMSVQARGMLSPNLEGLFAGDAGATEKRRAVTRYLFGVHSTKELSMGQAVALRSWMGYRASDDGEWLPDPYAIREAQAVAAEQARAEGQQTLL